MRTALIRDRLQAFLDALPAVEEGPYGDGYNLLEALAERLGEAAAPAFDRYLKDASAHAAKVRRRLSEGQRVGGEWCLTILGRRLDDRRPVEGYAYSVYHADRERVRRLALPAVELSVPRCRERGQAFQHLSVQCNTNRMDNNRLQYVPTVVVADPQRCLQCESSNAKQPPFCEVRSAARPRLCRLSTGSSMT